jgi:hypothetical protein
MKCEYCGKSMKTSAGLAKHVKSSKYCIALKNRREKAATGGVNRESSGKDNSGVSEKSEQGGKRRAPLEEEDAKQPAKIRMVLDKATMQRLAMFARDDKVMLRSLEQKQLQNLGQQQEDSMGWLPYYRLLAREDFATFQANEDATSGEDFAAIGEDESVEDSEDSGTTGAEAGGMVTDDAGSALVEDNEEERFHWEKRKALPWNSFAEYVECDRKKFKALTELEQRAIKIMRTLIKKRAPLDTYQAVMAWHLQETGQLAWDEPVGQSPHFISRKLLMPRLRKRYHMDHQYAKAVTITLPHSKSKVTVWKKLARDNVLSLLTDPRWTDNDWLYFEDNPFAKPPEDYPFIEDLNTGEAYQVTHKKLITKPNQILVAVPLYIDGAVTGQFDKLQVTALKMSIGLLNRWSRDREYAWRTLGYVTNYTKEDSRGKRMFVESGHVAAHELYVDGISDEDEGAVGGGTAEVDKAADYHAILEVLLDSLKELIADGMTVDIYYKGKLYKDCELVFFVPFVKCDGDEGDKLCCSYRSRGAHVKQLCRHCTCPTDKTDDPTASYPYKTESMMRQLYEKNAVVKLRNLSQICIKNAFHGLRFGLHNDRGIHGATPWELLHGILLGHFKYIRDCLFLQLGETSAAASEVNALAQEIGKLLQRQSDRNKPRTKFAKGILKGKLMAKEYTGVLLVMAALLQSKKGKELLTSARRKDFKAVGQISDWILLVETMLQWEAYLNLPQMEKRHVHRLKKKHVYLLYLLKRVGNRQKGMGFKIMKFHAVLHLCVDILMFGVPMVVDTGSNESHHKTTKIAAKLTQKDVQTFEKQTSDRLDDFHVLELAMEEMNGRPLGVYSEGYDHGETGELAEKTTTGGMIINVSRDNETQQLSFSIVTRMKYKKAVALDPEFLQYLCAIQDDLVEFIDKIPICAEHCRSGQMFRAHANYRGKGPWKDWVMIEWQTGEYPAQIWSFLDLTELAEGVSVKLNDGTFVQKGVWAVIESCFFVNEMDEEEDARQSELFRPIILETSIDHQDRIKRKFYMVDVETFKRPLVVIPNIGTTSEYLMMTPRSQWGTDFVKWIMAPHTIDEAEMKEIPAPDLLPKQEQQQSKKANAPKKRRGRNNLKKASIPREQEVSDSESGSESNSDASSD